MRGDGGDKAAESSQVPLVVGGSQDRTHGQREISAGSREENPAGWNAGDPREPKRTRIKLERSAEKWNRHGIAGRPTAARMRLPRLSARASRIGLFESKCAGNRAPIADRTRDLHSRSEPVRDFRGPVRARPEFVGYEAGIGSTAGHPDEPRRIPWESRRAARPSGAGGADLSKGRDRSEKTGGGGGGGFWPGIGSEHRVSQTTLSAIDLGTVASTPRRRMTPGEECPCDCRQKKPRDAVGRTHRLSADSQPTGRLSGVPDDPSFCCASIDSNSARKLP